MFLRTLSLLTEEGAKESLLETFRPKPTSKLVRTQVHKMSHPCKAPVLLVWDGSILYTRDCSSLILVKELCLLVVYFTLEMPSHPKPLINPPASQTYSSQKAEEPDLREKIWERDR
jgi:hypothetical protein